MVIDPDQGWGRLKKPGHRPVVPPGTVIDTGVAHLIPRSQLQVGNGVRGRLQLNRRNIFALTDIFNQPMNHPYRGVSAEERRAKRREQLVQAAKELYGRIGFRNATVKAVCEAAGLTERYFYESFPNSDALLSAVFETSVEEVRDYMSEASEHVSRPGKKKVEAVLRAYFESLAGNPSVARVFLVEIRGIGHGKEAILNRGMEILANLLESAWGRDPTPSHTMIKTCVAGGLIHMATAWLLTDCETPIEELVDVGLQISVPLSPLST